MGYKVSIVTHKPHTTRKMYSCAKSLNDCELVFMDTPGIDKVNDKLGTVIFNNMQNYLKSLDNMMLVIDCTQPKLSVFLPYISQSIVVINKIDYVKKHKLLPLIQQLQALNAKKIFCVCAKTGDGVKDILEYLKSESLLVETPAISEVLLSTKDDILNYACECVREKILLQFEEEIPYKIMVVVKSYSLPEKSAWTISLNIIVPKESYKPIIIGKKCERLKSIGKSVRLELSFKLKQSGYLGLNLVVDEELWKKKETYYALGWDVNS